MTYKQNPHTFHIPVMGIGYTIDTPAKVAQFGISSVISLVDDILMEKMRELYSSKLNITFKEISEKIEDFRAKRITDYLNIIDQVVTQKFEELKKSATTKGGNFEKYLDMLPDTSQLKKMILGICEKGTEKELQDFVDNNLPAGSIDVNIMTKIDNPAWEGNKQLPIEFNDAHAAVRGFANSNLSSSVVFSAGMSAKLYSYLEGFEDFYPDKNGFLKKKITLKVSDFRSALIQGKFLANKGLWVSEYRIESGLNCGGHTFASNGKLMGPILEEFKVNRKNLIEDTHDLYTIALDRKKRYNPGVPFEIKITAQGGVGTAQEQNFLLEHYELDSIGWGTPFLLVDGVANVDNHTIDMLKKATEKDLYLSDISPLNVPFNSLRGNTRDQEKEHYINKGIPGSFCTKRYLSFNTEFSARPICTASRQYQKAKIADLDSQELSPVEYKKAYNKVVEKSCICAGLGTTAMLVNGFDTKPASNTVSVCPGPNMAYFTETVSLSVMCDHIYGRTNIIKTPDRPNMFIKELEMYIDFHKKNINESLDNLSDKQMALHKVFEQNISDGIQYYKELFLNLKSKYELGKIKILNDLEELEGKLKSLDLAAILVDK